MTIARPYLVPLIWFVPAYFECKRAHLDLLKRSLECHLRVSFPRIHFCREHVLTELLSFTLSSSLLFPSHVSLLSLA